jgi:uncharacterized protein
MAGKFEIKKGAGGFRWNLKSGNGEIVASSERYTTKAKANKGIASVKKAAAAAKVVDLTKPAKKATAKKAAAKKSATKKATARKRPAKKR